jgi:hypothetical protein
MLAATPATAAANLSRFVRGEVEVVRLAVSGARALLEQAAAEAKPSELHHLADDIDRGLGQLEVLNVVVACAEQEPTPADVLNQVMQALVHALSDPVETTAARHRGHTLAADRVAAWVRRTQQ